MIKYTFNNLTIQKCVVYCSVKVAIASPQACKVQKMKQKYMGGVRVGEGVSAKKKKNRSVHSTEGMYIYIQPQTHIVPLTRCRKEKRAAVLI